jgi:FkbM family methyltransferase
LTTVQKLIQFLNASGKKSLTAKVKAQVGSVIRTVVPQWPGLGGIFMRLYSALGNSLVHCHVEGAHLLIDSRDKAIGHYLLCGKPYETQEVDLLRKCLKPGGRFLDIGANIGYFTVLAAKHVGTGGEVVAFEPEPHNFKILKKNIELNDLTNVLIENYAAIDQKRKLTLYLSSYNFGDHRIFDGDDDSMENIGRRKERVDVQGVRLDDYLRVTHFKPDFIKIDVQGAENSVLAGLTGTLAECEDIQLLLEIWPDGMRQFGTDPSEVLNLLAALGLQVFQLQSDGTLASFSMQNLSLLQGPKEYVNVFACRYPERLPNLGIRLSTHCNLT